MIERVRLLMTRRCANHVGTLARARDRDDMNVPRYVHITYVAHAALLAMHNALPRAQPAYMYMYLHVDLRR